MKRLALFSCGVLLVLATGLPRVRPAAGDVFVLPGGGRIEGELLNPDENPRKTWVVKPAIGGRITLDVAQVADVQITPPDVAALEKIRAQYPDTVEGQTKLAEWCREQGLSAQRKAVLRHIIDDLDAGNEIARRTLGYEKHDGEWYTLDEWMQKNGRVKYNGKWMLPQEMELAELKRKQELEEKEWAAKITRWRNWLANDKTAKQARENLTSITSNAATKPLATKLKSEKSQDAKLIYIEALGKIDTVDSRAKLAMCAIDDEMEEVRLSCVDELEKSRKKTKDQFVVRYFIKLLKPNSDNKIITRAAVALSRLKDPEAILPLVKVLVVYRKVQVSSGGGSGSMTTTFNKNGKGGGMGMNQQPQTVTYEVHNQATLDALVSITQQNFSYDQRAWETWYFSQQKPAPAVDVRRGG